MEAREAILKARDVFLKIGDPNDTIARQAAYEFRALMDEWGITLENMHRFTKKNWKPLASRAVAFWRESREAASRPDPNSKGPSENGKRACCGRR